MEKICIVKRRKDSKPLDSDHADHLPPKRVAQPPISDPSLKEGDLTISVHLKPEQCEIALSNEHVRDLLGKTVGDIKSDVEIDEKGQIVFNFHFKHVQGARSLKPEHVCQMLQISKGMLMKLIKEEKIKSYRIGRLRRFLLSDVLEFITDSQESQDGWYLENTSSVILLPEHEGGLKGR